MRSAVSPPLPPPACAFKISATLVTAYGKARSEPGAFAYLVDPFQPFAVMSKAMPSGSWYFTS